MLELATRLLLADRANCFMQSPAVDISLQISTIN